MFSFIKQFYYKPDEDRSVGEKTSKTMKRLRTFKGKVDLEFPRNPPSILTARKFPSGEDFVDQMSSVFPHSEIISRVNFEGCKHFCSVAGYVSQKKSNFKNFFVVPMVEMKFPIVIAATVGWVVGNEHAYSGNVSKLVYFGNYECDCSKCAGKKPKRYVCVIKTAEDKTHEITTTDFPFKKAVVHMKERKVDFVEFVNGFESIYVPVKMIARIQ